MNTAKLPLFLSDRGICGEVVLYPKAALLYEVIQIKIPELDGAVTTGGGEGLAIGAETDAPDPSAMACQGLQ